MDLRPYQAEAHNACTTGLLRDRATGTIRHRGIVDACVGAGKSLLIGEMARWEAERGGRTLVLAPAMELIVQDAAKVAAQIGYEPGIYSASLNRKETESAITVASVHSLARNPMACGNFSLVLLDEVHGCAPHMEGIWHKVLGSQDADWIGYTGTPWRLQSGPIYGPHRHFKTLDYRISLQQLTDAGYLAPMKIKGRGLMVLDKIRKVAGEYDTGDQEEVIDPVCVVRALEAMAADRKSILIYTPGVESGRRLTQALLHAGHTAGEVYGDTPTDVRDALTSGFRAGTYRFLVNTGCLTTGFDAPNTDCVVLLRKTASSALLIQMIGRALRLKSHGGDALILDYAGNFSEHPHPYEIEPPPDDVERPTKKKTRKCPACEEVVPDRVQQCPACGHVWPKQDRDIQIADDDRPVLTKEALGDAISWFADAAAKAKAKNGKPMPVLIQFKTRYGVWPSREVSAAAGHRVLWTFDRILGKRTAAWV